MDSIILLYYIFELFYLVYPWTFPSSEYIIMLHKAYMFFMMKTFNGILSLEQSIEPLKMERYSVLN